ncbi:sporulation integral membrane protein YtvI [Clostridium gasigenes]|uniref:sporulation integral membrane protein YtvI n=1 Tax=Clostridium gasigenes TaxID=94869 RepID=UPI001626E3CB|nr:sporulation integral membrane protein YtvI [Clostridium gasigenes]MBB6623585.1 sporulation integral membrane protein YtvI [Clostridium gasigenes]
MNIEKKKDFIINVLYYSIVISTIFIVIKYGIVWFMPFVIGFVVAFILKPLINLISSKLHINRKPVAAVIVLLFYSTVGVLLVLLVTKVSISVKDVFLKLPSIYETSIEPTLYGSFDKVEDLMVRIDPNLIQGVQDITESLSKSLGSIIGTVSSNVISLISTMVSSVPTVFIIIGFSIISSFFIAIDYKEVTGFIVKQFPEKLRITIFDIKDYTVGTLFNLIKAYGIIISITFIELSLGLSILGVHGAIGIALSIALLDILPVIETGGVLIPWVIIQLAIGNIGFALGLLTLYIIITVIRNIIEPKIVGNQIGVHPLIMLMCIFIGVRVFGFAGLFILPIIIITLKNLNSSGKIHMFKL